MHSKGFWKRCYYKKGNDGSIFIIIYWNKFESLFYCKISITIFKEIRWFSKLIWFFYLFNILNNVGIRFWFKSPCWHISSYWWIFFIKFLSFTLKTSINFNNKVKQFFWIFFFKLWFYKELSLFNVISRIF